MDDKGLLTSSRKWLFLVFLFLVAGMVLAGCNLRTKPDTSKIDNQTEVPNNGKRQLVLSSERSQVVIYFATSDQEYLLPITIDINPSKEVAKVAVEKLLAGPNSNFLSSTIPEGTKLKDIYFAEKTGTVFVDLTKAFLDIKDSQEVLLALNSLVYTLTELPGVEQVQIYVEGETLEELQGVKMDEPLKREYGINYVGQSQGQEEQITVFYGDENAMFMVPVTFDAPKATELLDKANAALKQLVKGPPKKGSLTPVLWEGTKIISIGWDQQGKTLVVDFSKEIVGYGGGTAFEKLLTNSLVYTLTALPEVDKVQILIEGEKWNYLPEGTDIYNPLTKPEKLNYNQTN